MITHQIVYIHGVNTRKDKFCKRYSEELDRRIHKKFKKGSIKLEESVELVWGNVNQQHEDDLLNNVRYSRIWSDLELKDFREKQVLQFVGDAALYISRMMGSKIVHAIWSQLEASSTFLQNTQSTVVHLVAHSWGTIILFDILFAKRWTDPTLPITTRKEIDSIRSMFFGLDPSATTGHRIVSINTMGSPLALFSLMNTESDGTHAISSNLAVMIKGLSAQLKGKTIPWNNFLHPGDLIGWPLEKILPLVLSEAGVAMPVMDHITDPRGFDLEPLGLLFCGEAHASYWSSQSVVDQITKTIRFTDQNIVPLLNH